jgi:hypothetical protein
VCIRYTKCITDPSTDITSNIANINIEGGMDVDQAGALSGGMDLAMYFFI